MCDDNRPILTVTYPKAGSNAELSRILLGMYDYGTGLDRSSFEVTADFAVDGLGAGQSLVAKFKEKSTGVWELLLANPIKELPKGKLSVSVRDKQGNVNRIDRTFFVAVRKD
jgi:hypothetical protein